MTIPVSAANWDELAAAALAARDRSYAPYSDFRVGAALLYDDGRIVAGCNVENSSYGVSICAERVALGTAVTAGLLAPRAIAVATDMDPPARPCGPCLQALAEFAQDLPILLLNPTDTRETTTLRTLLPQAFRLPRRSRP